MIRSLSVTVVGPADAFDCCPTPVDVSQVVTVWSHRFEFLERLDRERLGFTNRIFEEGFDSAKEDQSRLRTATPYLSLK